MRKSRKKKRHSCPLCKPNKMGLECRWRPKEFERIRRSEKEILDIMRKAV